VKQIKWAVPCGGVWRCSVTHEKEGPNPYENGLPGARDLCGGSGAISPTPHYSQDDNWRCESSESLAPYMSRQKRGHESSAFDGNQDRTCAKTSNDLSSVHSCTNFRRLFWYGKRFRILRKIIYQSEQVLITARCQGIGTSNVH